MSESHEAWCGAYIGQDCNCTFDTTEPETSKMAKLLLRIAYPNRGSKDETASLQDFADEIQKTWSSQLLSMISKPWLGVDNESQDL